MTLLKYQTKFIKLKQNTSRTNFLNGKVEFIPSRVVVRQSRARWREVVVAKQWMVGGQQPDATIGAGIRATVDP